MHRIRTIAAGRLLRIQAWASFRLRLTANEWQSYEDSRSSEGFGVQYVDIPVPEGQRAPLRFTFFWLETARWEGPDYMIEVRS